MWEDRMHQFFLGGLQCAGNTVSLDQLRYFRTNHMGAEQFTCLCVKNGLNQAFRLSKSNRLTISDERKAADTDLITGLFRFRFGNADSCLLYTSPSPRD